MEKRPPRASRIDLQLCHGPSCRLAGSGALTTKFETLLGFTTGDSTPGGKLRLASAPCLGACGLGVALCVNGKLVQAPHAACTGTDEAAKFIQRLRYGEKLPRGAQPGIYGSGPLADLLRSKAGDPPSLESGAPALRTPAKFARPSARKTLFVNAHRGIPSDLAERLFLERAPHAVLQAALALAEKESFTRIVYYIPALFPRALSRLRAANRHAAWRRRWPRHDCEVSIMRGGSAFIAAEDSAAREALAGRALLPRPEIYPNSDPDADASRIMGVQELLLAARPTGTLCLTLAHGFKKPGVHEFPLETPLIAVIAEHGATPRPAAAHAGGAFGRLLRPAEFSQPLKVVFAAGGWNANHSLLLLKADEMAAFSQASLEFCALESCGKCVPCRAGSYELLREREPGRRQRLIEALHLASLCRLGTATGEILGEAGARPADTMQLFP